MAAALPDARLVRVAGGGHLVALERPAEVADALLSFLTEAVR
jgi:pimeloyl-ACP methyl ester carboxylesterase